MANLQVEVNPTTSPLPGELHRISLDVYRGMGDLGLLFPSDRVELLDGLLVKKMNKGPRHVTVTHRIFTLLLRSLPPGWFPRKEDPIELPAGPEGDSVPEPDVAVVSGVPEDYNGRHPNPDEIGLVIEVSSSPGMLARDRKGLSRYAWAGVPSVWIVNLTDERVEVYSGPSGRGPNPHYERTAVQDVGTSLAIALGEHRVVVPVDAIMR